MQEKESGCAAVPIVVRATTSTALHSTARDLAVAASSSNGGATVHVSGCWQAAPFAHPRLALISLSSEPACDERWQRRHLFNKRSRHRLAAHQVAWAASDLLTAAAVRHVLRASCAPPHVSGAGCTAFVIDPDVLLLGSVAAACSYYDALRHDAVLHFQYAGERARVSLRRPSLQLLL